MQRVKAFDGRQGAPAPDAPARAKALGIAQAQTPNKVQARPRAQREAYRVVAAVLAAGMILKLALPAEPAALGTLKLGNHATRLA